MKILSRNIHTLHTILSAISRNIRTLHTILRALITVTAHPDLHPHESSAQRTATAVHDIAMPKTATQDVARLPRCDATLQPCDSAHFVYRSSVLVSQKTTQCSLRSGFLYEYTSVFPKYLNGRSVSPNECVRQGD